MLRSKILNTEYLILLVQLIKLFVINEVKAEIPSVNNLATTAALTGAENKISYVSNLVKKLSMTQKLI